jgi:phage regulator Rha-like protein
MTTSLLVANGCDNRSHESTLKLIRKYRSDFEELGFLRFEIQEKRGTQGASTEYCLLNEDQATLLITYFKNTPTVRRFKLKLVKEFRAALNEIQRLREQRLTFDWQEARANSKCIRNNLTVAVRSLERLADRQGGEKGKPENRHYYETITRMVYKALFGDSSLKQVRDKIDVLQLQFLSICESACQDEIERLVDLDVDYHQIYQECKKRLSTTVDGLSASKLTSQSSPIKLIWERQ